MTQQYFYRGDVRLLEGASTAAQRAIEIASDRGAEYPAYEVWLRLGWYGGVLTPDARNAAFVAPTKERDEVFERILELIETWRSLEPRSYHVGADGQIRAGAPADQREWFERAPSPQRQRLPNKPYNQKFETFIATLYEAGMPYYNPGTYRSTQRDDDGDNFEGSLAQLIIEAPHEWEPWPPIRDLGDHDDPEKLYQFLRTCVSNAKKRSAKKRSAKKRSAKKRSAKKRKAKRA
jgi:hypothetical protein